LITSSNFEGCSIGKSAGLVPFRILSTKSAARRRMLALRLGRPAATPVSRLPMRARMRGPRSTR
jgi:hypothetical protein